MIKLVEGCDTLLSANQRASFLTSFERLFWLTVLVGHLIAAALWWWLEPGGFPWGHPRSWSNQVLPVFAFIWICRSLLSLHREDRRRLLIELLPIPAAWLAAAITARLAFPITFAWFWLIPLGGSLIMAAFLVIGGRGNRRLYAPSRFLIVAAGLAIGSAAVLANRPAPPGTRPLLTDLPDASRWVASSQHPAPGVIDLGSEARLYTSEGSLNVRLAPLTLIVNPLLRFISRSPDGCWTVFAGMEDRDGPQPRLRGGWMSDGESWVMKYDFPNQGLASLHVKRDSERKALLIDAAARLDRPVFSHLNSFCDFEVRGHRRLSLEFSPCPGNRIEVLHYEYPIGRPARFAFVDEARNFRVVEASSGEKGPFRTLSEGVLERLGPLGITLWDEDRPVGRITLLDWAAQASSQLSPTAGWGVAENAIEFSLSGNESTSPASLFITLAATSVGRGWDSVGHAAGTYRNRIKIEPGGCVDH